MLADLIKYKLYRTTHGSQAGEQCALRLPTFKIHPDDRERLEMARGRKPALAKEADALIKALAFASVASNNDHEHCIFESKTVLMSNGQLFAGHPVDEELECNPHLGKLLSALKKCGKTLSLAQLDSGRLSVKGDKLRVLVPCVSDDAMFDVEPDVKIAPATDELKKAFKVCSVLADEKGHTVIEASLLLENGLCTATDRHVMIQYWHGVSLPPNLVIPKSYADAVVKTESPIVGFGYTFERSMTLWFENGSWLKTLLYADKWPDVNAILDRPSSPVEVLPGLLKGIHDVAEFSDGTVYLVENEVRSHITAEEGAQYEVPGLQNLNKCYNSEYFNWVAPYITTLDLTTYPDRAVFFGEHLRGVIMGIVGQG